jgi:DNA-binding transcriptional regulator YiaG
MDSSESEIMSSTADVAKLLGVGSAMVRKWAIAYEAVTGDSVRLRSKRDGREFSASQVDIISRAKKYVDRERVKIDTALKMALGQADLVPTALDTSAEDLGSLEILKQFLARNDETNQLLLEEIRGLREDLRLSQARELNQQPAAKIKNSAQVEQSSSAPDKHYGLLVKFSIWLESLLRR